MSAQKQHPSDFTLEEFAQKLGIPVAEIKKLGQPDYRVRCAVHLWEWFYRAEAVKAVCDAQLAAIGNAWGWKKPTTDKAEGQNDE